MFLDHYASFNTAWADTLHQLVTSGELVHVRGKKTAEKLGHIVHFPMTYAMLTVPGRNISYDFMFREAWWILSGQNRLDLLTTHAPSYKRYSDDGIRLSGAYGPKIVDQIGYVVETLYNDIHSRQAVINIWRERPAQSKDIPCTLSVQFLIRNDSLHAVVNMRSNDAWMGMPYDVFTFTMLAVQVALELAKTHNMVLHLGYMHHFASSRHIYLYDEEKAKSVAQSENYKPCSDPPRIEMTDICSVIPDTTAFHSILHDRSINKLPEPLLKYLPWLNPTL